MIISREHPDAVRYKIHDCTGQVIPYVTFFDTDTCEIEMAICLRTEKIKQTAEGEYLIVTDDDEDKNVKETPCLLMQANASDAEGNSQVGYTFVRFTLPGSYATCDGHKITSNSDVH